MNKLRIAVIEKDPKEWSKINRSLHEIMESRSSSGTALVKYEGEYIKKETIPEAGLVSWIFDSACELIWINPTDINREELIGSILNSGFHLILISIGFDQEEDIWINKNIIKDLDGNQVQETMERALEQPSFWLINELSNIRKAGGFIPYIAIYTDFGVIFKQYRYWILSKQNVLISYDKTQFGIEESKDVFFYAAHASVLLPNTLINGKLSYAFWRYKNGYGIDPTYQEEIIKSLTDHHKLIEDKVVN